MTYSVELTETTATFTTPSGERTHELAELPLRHLELIRQHDELKRSQLNFQIAKLEVGENDCLVVRARFRGEIDRRDYARHINSIIPDVRVLVIPPEVELSVVSVEEVGT